ncbi:MAG: PadR family transcriptional regulator [Gemmatimonadota bacterium]|jgi:transcriptional regulator
MPVANANLLRGTLELLILRSLVEEKRHGYGILEWLERMLAPELLVEEGTLYPALHRMEAEGLIAASWGQSENNRRAKYYRLTRKGSRRVASESASWRAYAERVLRVLEGEAGS